MTVVNILMLLLSSMFFVSAFIVARQSLKIHKLKLQIKEQKIRLGIWPGDNTNRFWHNTDLLERATHCLEVGFQTSAATAFAFSAITSTPLLIPMIPAWITFIAVLVVRRRWNKLSAQEKKEQAIFDKLKRIPVKELIERFESIKACSPHAPAPIPSHPLVPKSKREHYNRLLLKYLKENIGFIVFTTYWTEEDALEVLEAHINQST